MSNKINIDELKSMIANKIKQIDLHGVLDEKAVERVKEKVMGVYNHDKAIRSIPEVIPEANIPVGPAASEMGIFPNGGFGTGEPTGRTSMIDTTSVEAPSNNYDSTQQPGQNIDMSTTGNIPAYSPQIPSILDNIEPAKVIVFSQNELSDSGENLSNKPLRTYEDPDTKKSMNEFWMDKGQRKADVYMTKLEKIGELVFDYRNGTTQFIEKRFDPDFEAQAKYKENPYMVNSGPATPGVLDINGQPNIMAQVASSVDIQKVVSDIVMNILRNQLLTNTTKAINDEPQIKIENKPWAEVVSSEPASFSVPANFKSHPTLGEQQRLKEMSPEEPTGYNIAQAAKPMEESFNLKMIDLVNEFEKIDTPVVLKEAIEKNDIKFLSKESEEVQEWIVEGKKFYTPVNKLSTRKCYIKS